MRVMETGLDEPEDELRVITVLRVNMIDNNKTDLKDILNIDLIELKVWSEVLRLYRV